MVHRPLVQSVYIFRQIALEVPHQSIAQDLGLVRWVEPENHDAYRHVQYGPITNMRRNDKYFIKVFINHEENSKWL